MAKPYIVAPSAQLPLMSPQAKKAAEDKRRRELIDEAETMRARKEEVVLNEYRAQEAKRIAGIDWSQYKPTVEYIDGWTGPEPTEMPLPSAQGVGDGKGGPQNQVDPAAPWANDPVVGEAPTQPTQSANPWDNDPVVGESPTASQPPVDDIDAAINEAVSKYPGGYKGWLDKNQPAPEGMAWTLDPLAQGEKYYLAPKGTMPGASGAPPAPETGVRNNLNVWLPFFNDVTIPLGNKDDPWNEQVADLLGSAVDSIFEPINSRQVDSDPLKASSQVFLEGMARMPEQLIGDPVQFEDDYNPVKQAGRAYNNLVDAGGDAIEGDFNAAGKKAYDALVEGGSAALTVAGIRAPRPRGVSPPMATPASVPAAIKQAAQTNVPSAPVPKAPAPVREPTVREARKTLAAAALPNRIVRPQALRSIERILTHSNIPKDRIATGLTRIVEGLQSGVDGASLRSLTVAQLLEREFRNEFPEIEQNLRTVLQERRLTKKAGDASPTIVRAMAQGMRETQTPFIQDSATRNLGDAEVASTIDHARRSQVPRVTTAANRAFGPEARTGTREQIEARLRQLGQEGYEPILRQPIDDQHAEDLVYILHGPQMGELMTPLRQIAAGDGIDIDTMIANDPLRAAHWVQHAARVKADEAFRKGDTSLGNSYSRMRARILAEIDDLQAPDGRTYRDFRREYGDEIGTRNALEAGNDFGAIVSNPDEMNQFLARIGDMTSAQRNAAMASIRDWVFSRVRGGQEDAPARIDQLTQIGILDAFDRIGPEGQAFARELRAIRADNRAFQTIESAGNSFAALAQSPERLGQVLGEFRNLSPQQQQLFLGSVRDWVLGRTRGGQEDAAARIGHLSQIGVLDALDNLGPGAKALADDIRAIRDEERFLGSFYPKAESQTASNAVALAQGPDIYSRGGSSSAATTAVADAGLMMAGISGAPVLTALREGPRLYSGLMRPKTATREDMTRILTARPGAQLADAINPPETPAGAPIVGGGGAGRNPVTTEERDFLLNEIMRDPEASLPAPTGRPQENAMPNGLSESIMGGAGATYGTFGPLRDMDGDGDMDDDDRRQMIVSYTMGGLATPMALRGGAKLAKAITGDTPAGNTPNPDRAGIFHTPVGFPGGSPPKKGNPARVDFEPRDLVLARNERDGTYYETGVALGMDPDNPQVTSTITQLVHRTRKVIEGAKARGQLDELAGEWNVDRAELENFLVRQQKNPNSGRAEAALSKAADIVERAARMGEPVTLQTLTDRLRASGHDITQGTLEVLMSKARTGNGAYAIPEELQARIRNLPKLARKDYERASDIDANSIFGGGRRSPQPEAEATVANLIEDATQTNLVAAQKAAIERGEVPPVFKTFRMPDGRIIAWNGDESRGGFSHAEAREILGLGDMRLEHGQFKWGDDLSRTNWYDVTGKGQAPRSVEREVRVGTQAGKQVEDVIMDMTPEELIRDMRGIGAIGPGNRVTDYPYRRDLATGRDLVKDEHTVQWETRNGDKAQVSFGAGGAPDIEIVQFRLNGKTSNNDGSSFIPQADAKAAFEKAMSVFEREAISRGKDVYLFDGATPAHNRFYAQAVQRLGAPQGYLAIIDPKNGNFAFIRQARFDADVKSGRINPQDWTVIPSKRGAREVPEWRKRTGLFAVPAGAGLAAAILQGEQEAVAEGREVDPRKRSLEAAILGQ